MALGNDGLLEAMKRFTNGEASALVPDNKDKKKLSREMKVMKGLQSALTGSMPTIQDNTSEMMTQIGAMANVFSNNKRS